jgi:hypothetical protein
VVCGFELEDYELLMEGNKDLLVEHDALHERSLDLESKLTKARASAIENIAGVEVRVRSTEAYAMDVATTGEKCFCDFEKGLMKDLAELRVLHQRKVQSIKGLCSLMPEIESLVADYIHWLSMEVTGPPEVFAGVNKNFVSAAVEGTLVMAGGSVDLAALQASAINSGRISCPQSDMCR